MQLSIDGDPAGLCVFSGQFVQIMFCVVVHSEDVYVFGEHTEQRVQILLCVVLHARDSYVLPATQLLQGEHTLF